MKPNPPTEDSSCDFQFIPAESWPLLSVQFSRSVVSYSRQPHGLQHARLPCPSSNPGACWNSCPSSWWCHPMTCYYVIPFSSCPLSFPAPGSFSNESVLRIRWPKYWSFSFSISPSHEYSGLISFRIDWLDSLQSKGLSRVFSNSWKVWPLLSSMTSPIQTESYRISL